MEQRIRKISHIEQIRRDIVEHYLDTRASPIAHELADDFNNNKRPLATTIVAIPVAAHQDSGLIHNALQQYANQQKNDPFSICLLLNAPENADPESWNNAASQARRSAITYPNLDVRIAAAKYDNPTIGAIRKDLWDAIAYRALEDGAYNQPKRDHIIINNDIDVISMSPHYLQHVQHYYNSIDNADHDWRTRTYTPHLGSTALRHALPINTHPNTASGILWTDLVQLQKQRGGTSGGFEAGLTVPLSKYAQAGGFRTDSSLAESFSLINGENGQNTVHFIPGTWLHTSPRRYIERFPEHGFADIWTDDSFGARDRCRDTNLQLDDATKEQRDSHIRRSFPGVQAELEQLANEKLYKTNQKLFIRDTRKCTPLANERYLTELRESSMLCVKALRRLIKNDALADEFAMYYDAAAVQLYAPNLPPRHHW